MADIQKCTGTIPEATCPMRMTCRRYLAMPHPKQEWGPTPMYQLSDGGEWKCDEYWRVVT